MDVARKVRDRVGSVGNSGNGPTSIYTVYRRVKRPRAILRPLLKKTLCVEADFLRTYFEAPSVGVILQQFGQKEKANCFKLINLLLLGEKHHAGQGRGTPTTSWDACHASKLYKAPKMIWPRFCWDHCCCCSWCCCCCCCCSSHCDGQIKNQTMGRLWALHRIDIFVLKTWC